MRADECVCVCARAFYTNTLREIHCDGHYNVRIRTIVRVVYLYRLWLIHLFSYYMKKKKYYILSEYNLKYGWRAHNFVSIFRPHKLEFTFNGFRIALIIESIVM